MNDLVDSVGHGVSGSVDDSGESGGPDGGCGDDAVVGDDWSGNSGVVNDRSGNSGPNNGGGVHNWSVDGRHHWSVDSRSEDGGGNSGMDHWSVDVGWGQDGVGWSVGNAANNGNLTLSSGEDVGVGVGDLGSMNLRGVNWSDDGGSGGDWEGVGSYPVPVVVGSVVGGDWDSLGGDVGEGARHATSSIPNGSVGLTGLAVSPSSLAEFVLGVVLGLGDRGNCGDGGSGDDGGGG